MKTKRKNIRHIIIEDYPEDTFVFMDPAEYYDKNIIGICDGNGIKPKVVYDYNGVIRSNMKMGMTEEEAIEYFEFNQIGSYMGESTPVFLHKYNK